MKEKRLTESCPIIEYDFTQPGIPQTGEVRCPVCKRYEDIDKKKQLEAAVILERGTYDVSYFGDGLWKLQERKKGGYVEFINAKTLIERARQKLEGPIRKTRKKRADKEGTSTVSLNQGKRTRSLEKRVVDSDSNERRLEQEGIRGNGKRSSKAVRGDVTRSNARVRTEIEPVRKPRKRISRSTHSNSTSEASLESKGRRKADRSKPVGTRSRDGVQPKTRRRINRSSVSAKTRGRKRTS